MLYGWQWHDQSQTACITYVRCNWIAWLTDSGGRGEGNAALSQSGIFPLPPPARRDHLAKRVLYFNFDVRAGHGSCRLKRQGIQVRVYRYSYRIHVQYYSTLANPVPQNDAIFSFISFSIHAMFDSLRKLAQYLTAGYKHKT